MKEPEGSSPWSRKPGTECIQIQFHPRHIFTVVIFDAPLLANFPYFVYTKL